MTVNNIKTWYDANEYYNVEFKKIEAMDAPNETKFILLQQLNGTMTNIYKSIQEGK